MPAACGKDKNCRKVIESAERGDMKWFAFGDKNFTICFVGGRVVEMSLEYSEYDSTFSQVVTAAIQKFGKPEYLGNTTLQNSYGAQLTLGSARWVMPDGAVVTAEELTSGGTVTGTRLTTLSVRDAERWKKYSKSFSKEPKL